MRYLNNKSKLSAHFKYLALNEYLASRKLFLEEYYFESDNYSLEYGVFDKKDPRYKSDKRLLEELRIWEEIKKKAEQQALLKYGLRYVVDEYFPAKLKEMEKK